MARKIIDEKKFEDVGEWMALRAAESYVKSNGYDYGSMDSPNPIAIVKGEYYNHQLNLPHKWHNFTPFQKRNIDGTITGNFRNGPVTLTIYESYFN